MAARAVLRSMQRALVSSIPTCMLDNTPANDAKAWSELGMRELRMLIARGQVYQARRVAEMLRHGAEAGLPIEPYDIQEIHQLINAIDAVQAGRHFLALQQLNEIAGSTTLLIRWSTLMWQARSVAAEGDVPRGRELAEEGVRCGRELSEEASYWAICVAAELQAKVSETEEAEKRTFQAISAFIGQGETRGESLAYLTLATVYEMAGDIEGSAAAADLAYNTDVSWTGPALWLARGALQAEDVHLAERLLQGIPNPATNAYQMTRMLKLVETQQVSLEAVLRALELAEQPAGEETVQALEQLVQEQPTFWPARDILAWKLLFMDRPQAARIQRRAMVDESADRQSVAAVGLGLQLYKKHKGERGPGEPGLEGDEPGGPHESLTSGTPADEEPSRGAVRHSGFVGQISLFGVADLLQFLCSSRRTGVLVLSRQNEEAKVLLYEGALHWAVSPANPDVGQFLAEKLALSADQAVEVDRGMAIAHVVGEDSAEFGKVREALRELLHLTVRELVLDWTDGWFQFERGHYQQKPLDGLLFNSQGLLLDVMREIDEENR